MTNDWRKATKKRRQSSELVFITVVIKSRNRPNRPQYVKVQMSDLPSWVPPELEQEYREWQAQFDDYINQWSAAVGTFLEAKGYKRLEGGGSSSNHRKSRVSPWKLSRPRR